MNTALITGAGRGIGLATAKAFAKAGWKVLALDKDFSNFDLKEAERIEFDLQDLSGIRKLVEKREVDTLVNNAGVLYCDAYDSIPEQHRKEILAVNIEAPAELITALAPQMKARKSGRIVNVGSVAAFTGHPDLWYGITKAGILNLTKAWAKELGPHGVLVNAVAPGPVATELFDRGHPLGSDKRQRVIDSIPVKRVGTADDVARAVVFLLSPESGYITGQTLFVCGGTSISGSGGA